jgi:hypothetical protein
MCAWQTRRFEHTGLCVFGVSSEFTFPLVEERRRAVDILAVLRDREHWIVGTGRSVRPKSGPLARMVSEA